MQRWHSKFNVGKGNLQTILRSIPVDKNRMSTSRGNRTKLTALVMFIILVVGFYGLQTWLGNKFEQIINSDADREYDITFERLNVHFLLQGVDLENVRITPNHVKDSTTTILATVAHVDFDGIKWGWLVFRKQLDIRKIGFTRPDFRIALTPHASKHKASKQNVQQLFGDILSRGSVTRFSIDNGSARAHEIGKDSVIVLSVHNINIDAHDIETDSVQWKYPIPFKLSGFNVSIDSFKILPDDNTIVQCGSVRYNQRHSRLTINDISMRFKDGWRTAARRLGKQVDMIEFDLNELEISDIEADSDLYGDIDLRASTIKVDGLDFHINRDKNLLRPPDEEKPMFGGMVKSIPSPLKVDSILIRDSYVAYSEVPEGSQTAGIVAFNDINGSISSITTIPGFQEEFETFRANLEAKFMDQARLYFHLQVPYDSEQFKLEASMKGFEMKKLNQLVSPLLGVSADSGTIQFLNLNMHATRTQSTNSLVMDYNDLKISILKDIGESKQHKPFLTAVAQSAIRPNNLPNTLNYLTASYSVRAKHLSRSIQPGGPESQRRLCAYRTSGCGSHIDGWK